MTNNSIDKTNYFDNNNSSINNSNKNNEKIKQKSPSEQFIFFKEDILKDIKELESKISLKYDMQNNINNNKINKIESSLEQMNQKIDYFSTSLTKDNVLKEKMENLSISYTKLDESLVLQDIRIKSLFNKLSETIEKYDNMFLESIIYPGIIGPKAKYKTFHELIDYFILSINQLLIFKEKILIDLKEYKYKNESSHSNFLVKLDYLSKNANAFTSSSIRTSERKMEQLFNKELEKYQNHINELKLEFNAYTDIQEEKIISILNNSKKIENLEILKTNTKKVENLEKIIENLQEKINEQNRKINLINKNKNTYSKKGSLDDNDYESQDKIVSKRSFNRENNFNSKNEYKIKNVTSILKDYIKGRISESELYGRRKRRGSVEYQISTTLQNIKENEKINVFQKKNSIELKNVKRNKSCEEIISFKQENENKSIEDNSEESEESKESEEIKESEEEEIEENENKKEEEVKQEVKIEKEEKKEKEEDGKKEELKIEKKEDENKKSEKIYKFQKYLSIVSGNDGNLISREKNINIKLNKQRNNEIEKSAMNFFPMSPQYSKIKPFSKINSISYNLENEQNNNINNNNSIKKKFFLTNKNFNSISNKNKKQINYMKSEQFKLKENSIEKSKKYENIDDVKTIINIIKRESRANLIPPIYSKKQLDKSINSPNNKPGSNLPEKIRLNSANKINNLNSRNKMIQIDMNSNSNSINNTNKNLSQIKLDSSKIKLKNNQNKEINQKNSKLPYYDYKKINKVVPLGDLNMKNQLKNVKNIEINFNPFPEETKEKDEQKMKKIFNQMKDFLPSDEKVLIKDRFIKFGYDKPKKNKLSFRDDEDINIDLNGLLSVNKIK